jgi:hypothetical protein
MSVKKLFAGACATAALTFGAAGPAMGATAVQDGLVNVAVGDVTIARDVNVGVAANVAANVCGIAVGPITALATEVDNTSNPATVCTTGAQAVRLVQN